MCGLATLAIVSIYRIGHAPHEDRNCACDTAPNGNQPSLLPLRSNLPQDGHRICSTRVAAPLERQRQWWLRTPDDEHRSNDETCPTPSNQERRLR